jgi:hypothetical protein
MSSSNDQFTLAIADISVPYPISKRVNDLWKYILCTNELAAKYKRDDILKIIAFGNVRDWSFDLGIFKKVKNPQLVIFNKTQRAIFRVSFTP